MRLPLAALPLALVLLSLLAQSAAAGTYHVYSCRTPGNVAAPTDGWTPSLTMTQATAKDQCASGGNLQMTVFGNVPQPNTGSAGFRYSVGDDLTIPAVTVWRNFIARHTSQDDSTAPAIWLGARTSNYEQDRWEWCGVGCDGLGVVTNAIHPANITGTDQLAGAHDLWFLGACFGYHACSVRDGGQPLVEGGLQGVDALLRDDFDPSVGSPGGSLVATGDHDGVESVTFAATDRGSGLFHTLIEYRRPSDTGWTTAVKQIVDGNAGRCAELEYRTDDDHEFGFRVPCKLQVSESADFDTTTVPDGDYMLRVLVEDAAGNLATVVPASTFTVENVPPPAASQRPTVVGTPVKGSTIQGGRGTWTGSGNEYKVQWLRCASADAASCGPIAGAEGDSYRVVTDDLGRHLRFRVTATNAEGSATEVSDPLGPVTAANGTVPQCADGADNDNDGRIDTDDAACSTREGSDESADTVPSGGFENPVTPPSGGGSTGAPSGPASPSVANGTNASDHARISLTGPRARTLRYGRTGHSTITLRDENGRPIGGASIMVLQRMSVPGAAFVAAHSPVTTDADGHVRYLIEPRYSRTLRFAYRSHLGDAAFSAVRDVGVTVLSKTSLRTDKSFLHNGQTVRFVGALRSRPVPRAGVVIDLQARVGRRWQTFNSLRTASDGKWRASYRFRSTSGLQTYVFRARVRGDTGFPYAPSISKRVKVRVRG